MPAGFVGSESNPIPITPSSQSFVLKIGDTFNPQFDIGSTSINFLNPQTTFHTNNVLIGHLDVLCFGCNGTKPAFTLLNSLSLPVNLVRPMVARVSLGVDATLPNSPFNANNSVLIEVWFARTGSAVNRFPQVSAGANQTVQFGQMVTLLGITFDPDGDSTTVSWTQIGGNGIQLNGANSLKATFAVPIESEVLTFQVCVNDGENPQECDNTVVTVEAPPCALSITMDDSPDPVIVGNNLPCTLTAINNGPGDTTGVTITNTLPEGVTFVSSSESSGLSAKAATVIPTKLALEGQAAVISITATAELGDLASGEEAAVIITVLADSVGNITNSAEVVGDGADPDASNNTATQNTQVLAQPPPDPPVDTIPILFPSEG